MMLGMGGPDISQWDDAAGYLVHEPNLAFIESSRADSQTAHARCIWPRAKSPTKMSRQSQMPPVRDVSCEGRG